MSNLFSLLVALTTLLSQVQNPGVPDSLRIQAYQVASVALLSINNPAPVPVSTAPNLGVDTAIGGTGTTSIATDTPAVVTSQATSGVSDSQINSLKTVIDNQIASTTIHTAKGPCIVVRIVPLLCAKIH